MKLLLIGIMFTLSIPVGAATVETFTSTGTYTWVCPVGVTSVKVECWGGGAAGLTAASGHGGFGGGGGSYARLNALTVIPGNSYAVVVGGWGITNTSISDASVFGGPTSFVSTSTCLATGGGRSSNSSYGGLASACIGDVAYGGGNGGSYASTSGGGGASSAGSASDGNNGGDALAIAPYTPGAGGVAPTGGYAGGDGAANNQNATPVPLTNYGAGGGGGGGFATYTGSRGAGGLVKLTYTMAKNKKQYCGTSRILLFNR